MLRLVNTAERASERASACLPIGTFLLPLYVNLIGSSGGEGMGRGWLPRSGWEWWVVVGGWGVGVGGEGKQGH